MASPAIDPARTQAQPPYVPPYTPPATATPTAVPGARLTDDQVRAEAERILNEGERFGTDDYDARLDEFARVTSTLDQDSATRLFQELRTQDSGAFNSWLQGDRLLGLNDAGRVTDAEVSGVVDTFATAYNNGAFANDPTPLGALSFLDQNAFTLVDPMGVLPGSETLGNIDRLLEAGDPALVDNVREGIGRDLIDQYSLGDAEYLSNGGHAAYAVHLMAGADEPTQAARVFGSYSADQRETILNDVALGSSTFGVNPNDPSAPADPLSQLMTEVGAKGYADPPLPSASGERWGDIATDIVRWAEGAEDALGQDAFTDFDNQPRPDRAEALSRLFNGHSEAILTNLTEIRALNFDVTSSNTQALEVGKDGVALGNLMRLTAFDGSSYASGVTRDLIGDYVADQRAIIQSGNPEDRAAAINSLSYIGAAGGDAVQQLNADIQADAESRKAVVEFVADIALSAIPLGDTLGGAATEALTDVFGDTVIRNVADTVSGELIDAATGQLTDAAKAAITDQLGPDGAALIDSRSAANLVRSSIFAGPDPTGSHSELTPGMTSASLEIERARTGGE